MVFAPVRPKQRQCLDMTAERAAPMVVLAMNIVGDGTAKRHELRARHDRREEPVRRGVGDDVR